MEIVCSADNNYVMPTGIMLTSLFENNKDAYVRVHFLDGGLTTENKERLSCIAQNYTQKQIIFYDIDDKLFEDFPINQANQSSHIHSMATYYRLYMAQILPNNVDKVIYLDGDLIVLDSLSDLWNWDVDNSALAAVPDPFNNMTKHYNALRYSMDLGYFNAGVLLINLKYWRENHVINDFLALIKNHPERLIAHDQDVLNFVFREKKKVLPLKFNMMPEFLYKPEFCPLLWKFEDDLNEGQKHPVIIHFTFVPKPWYKDSENPYKYKFEYYRQKTIWADFKEHSGIPLKNKVVGWCKSFLMSVGILQYKPSGKVKYAKIDF